LHDESVVECPLEPVASHEHQNLLSLAILRWEYSLSASTHFNLRSEVFIVIFVSSCLCHTRIWAGWFTHALFDVSKNWAISLHRYLIADETRGIRLEFYLSPLLFEMLFNVHGMVSGNGGFFHPFGNWTLSIRVRFVALSVSFRF
jgi:hypothetical protein